MNTEFKITGPGVYKRRDGVDANIIRTPVITSNGFNWIDPTTGHTYKDAGHFLITGESDAWDLVELVRLNDTPIGELPYERLQIATKILAGLCADGTTMTYLLEEGVNDAITLADKLIAKINETKP